MSRIYITATMQHGNWKMPTFNIDTTDHQGSSFHVGGIHPSSFAAIAGKGKPITMGERFDLKANLNSKRTSVGLVICTRKHLPHLEWSSENGLAKLPLASNTMASGFLGLVGRRLGTFTGKQQKEKDKDRQESSRSRERSKSKDSQGSNENSSKTSQNSSRSSTGRRQDKYIEKRAPESDYRHDNYKDRRDRRDGRNSRDSIRRETSRRDPSQRDFLHRESTRRDYPREVSFRRDSSRRDFAHRDPFQRDFSRRDLGGTRYRR